MAVWRNRKCSWRDLNYCRTSGYYSRRIVADWAWSTARFPVVEIKAYTLIFQIYGSSLLSISSSNNSGISWPGKMTWICYNFRNIHLIPVSRSSFIRKKKHPQIVQCQCQKSSSMLQECVGITGWKVTSTGYCWTIAKVIIRNYITLFANVSLVFL